VDLAAVEQFLYREARLADQHEYRAWESLWTDDARYWVPAGSDDPADMSVLFDNRARISTRIRQLETGKRHAQVPLSMLCRVVSNVELIATDGEETVVGANFVLAESREEGLRTWVGRATYVLREVDGDIRMAAKTVELVNRHEPLPTLAFLI